MRGYGSGRIKGREIVVCPRFVRFVLWLLSNLLAIVATLGDVVSLGFFAIFNTSQ